MLNNMILDFPLVATQLRRSSGLQINKFAPISQEMVRSAHPTSICYTPTYMGCSLTIINMLAKCFNNNRLLLLMVGLTTVWLNSAVALAASDGDAEVGERKAESCVVCHGERGYGADSNWPKLAGQHATYLVKQMQEYQRGREGGYYQTVMTPLMAALTQQDMQDIAAYYTKQSLSIGKADAQLVKQGEQLYRAGDFKKGIPACAACHGPRGLGNETAGFPVLSGQFADYIVTQLQAYQKGERQTDVARIMQMISRRMTEDEMHAVASYIQGLN